MLMLAALTVALGSPERPAGLVLPGEEAAYAAFIKGEAVAAAEIQSGRTCADFSVTDVSSRPINIRRANVPAANETIVLEGCGIRHVQNVEVARFGAAPEWRSQLGAVGDSLTNSGEQRAFIPEMFGYARANLNVTCEGRYFVLDTYVAAGPGNIAFTAQGYSPANPDQPSISYGGEMASSDRATLSKSWAEVWKLSVCGQAYTSLAVFSPAGDGTLSVKYVNLSSYSDDNLPMRAIRQAR